jgi:hypothetical protein
MTKPDPAQTQTRSSSRQWVRYAITLFLLGAVVVTGILAIQARDAWWQKYLNFIMGS